MVGYTDKIRTFNLKLNMQNMYEILPAVELQGKTTT